MWQFEVEASDHKAIRYIEFALSLVHVLTSTPMPSRHNFLLQSHLQLPLTAALQQDLLCMTLMKKLLQTSCVLTLEEGAVHSYRMPILFHFVSNNLVGL